MLLLIIDDHSLFRMGLQVILSQRLTAPVIYEASSIHEASTLVCPAPDVILLDIQMQGLSGLEAIGLLKKRWPSSPIVILSSTLNPQDASLSLERGAVAFLSKAESDKKIVQVITKVLAGEDIESTKPSLTLPAKETKIELTTRQAEILGLLCEGLTNKAIATRIHLSEFTVRGHIQSIFSLLCVSSRSQAIVAARRLGLVY
jgi:DNA-binding NarL/FixJ family response regulator